MDRTGPLQQVSDLILGAGPADMAGAPLVGRWVFMGLSDGMNVILVKGIGTPGEDPVLSLEQAKDAAGTGAKPLELTGLAYKLGAPAFAAANDLFADAPIDRDNPAASYVNTSSAEAEGVIVAYVLGQDLDINKGFSYIRAKVADVGAGAQTGVILYQPANRAYKGKQSVSLLA